MTESKSQRNLLLSSEKTQSTNASSKINSDSFEKEPNNKLKQMVAKQTSLFRSTPKSTVGSSASQSALLSSRQRTIRKHQKLQKPPSVSMNLGQVMINRWMGVLKNKLPQFDLEDEK